MDSESLWDSDLQRGGLGLSAITYLIHDFAEEVAAEPLQVGELARLLRRLALEEFGGAELPYVRDVAEMAQMSPEAVGRILADLRGESFDAWRARFESRLDQHGQRLASLELRQPDSLDPERLYDFVEEGKRRREQQSGLGLTIALALLSGFCLINPLCSGISKTSGPQSGQWLQPKVVHKENGHYFG